MRDLGSVKGLGCVCFLSGFYGWLSVFVYFSKHCTPQQLAVPHGIRSISCN
jgi:hypothetical protein